VQTVKSRHNTRGDLQSQTPLGNADCLTILHLIREVLGEISPLRSATPDINFVFFLVAFQVAPVTVPAPSTSAYVSP
jgi:hypothetical protein